MGPRKRAAKDGKKKKSAAADSDSIPPTETKKGAAGSSKPSQALGISLTLVISTFVALLAFSAGRYLRTQHAPSSHILHHASTPPSFEQPPDHIADDLAIDRINTCRSSQYISAVPTPGLHVTCARLSEDSSAYEFEVFPNSRDDGKAFTIPLPKSHASMALLRHALESRLNIRNRTVHPWQFFSSTGTLLDSLEAILLADVALVYEGGFFIWPGISVGHNQTVTVTPEGKKVVLQTLSLQPLVFSIDNFLDAAECDYIQEHATPHMKQSGVSLMDKDKGKQATEWRTSSTYFMKSPGHKPLQNIDKRVAMLTRTPLNHQEMVQVLRYEESQKYDAHHDYFDPKLYQRDPHTLRITKNGMMNRMATVLWYLSEVEDGGYTIFPREGGRTATSMTDCTHGLKVSPKKGRVIMFYSLLPTGEGDPLSLHGACPVIGKEPKWAANKWVWNGPIDFGNY